MTEYGVVLRDAIKQEAIGKLYNYGDEDKKLLEIMCSEIRSVTAVHLQHLAELDYLHIKGSGSTISKYIAIFRSETVRAVLMSQLVLERVNDCDLIALSLYKHFKQSNSYISKPGEPSSAHIYTRYDDAFRRLKPKRIKKELFDLINNPRDAFYLPYTVRLLSSWKIPSMKELLIKHSNSFQISAEELGFYSGIDISSSYLVYMQRNLRMNALFSLRYFPSDETIRVVQNAIDDGDEDIREIAKKTFDIIKGDK